MQYLQPLNVSYVNCNNAESIKNFSRDKVKNIFDLSKSLRKDEWFELAMQKSIQLRYSAS